MLNAMQIASLYAKIGADTRPFDDALRGSDRALQSFGSRAQSVGGKAAKSLAMMGAAVAATMAATAAAVTTAGFKFNNLSQQGEIAFTTMLQSGDKARAFLADLQDFAARTPFEYATLMEASQKMLAMGFKENDVLPTLTAIGDAVSALGGGQEKINRVTIAFGQMKAKGKVAAEEMLQLTEAGIPAWEMLAEAIGVSIPEAMKMVEKRTVDADTAIAAVVGGMNKRFGGMMAEQSKTFGGLWSTIMDTFQITSGKITKPLFDAVTRAFGRIVAFTNTPQFTAGVERLTAWVAQLTERAEGMASAMASKFMPTVRGIGRFVSGLAAGANTAARAFGDRFLPAIKGIIRFVAAIPDAWRKFREIVDNVNDPGLARTLNRLRASFSGLGKVLGNLARPFKEAFSGLFQSLMVARGSGWAGIFDVLITRLMKAVSGFGQALNNEAIPFVLQKLRELGNAIKGWLGGVDWWDTLKGWASAFAAWAGEIWGKTQPHLAALWSSLTGWVTDDAKRQQLWDAVRGAWNAVTRWARKIWDWAKPHLQSGWEWLSGWFAEPAKRQQLWDAVRGAWNAVTRWAGKIWDWAKPKLAAAWTSITSWVSEPTKRTQLFDKAKAAWDGITRWAGKAWDWARPKLNAMWTSLASWVIDPNKRDMLRARVSMAWTGFTKWAGEVWGKIEPKLNTAYASMKKWIDENLPNLTPWVDMFEGFAKSAAEQWGISFPNMQEDFSALRETLEREAPLIANALSQLWKSLFGGPEEGDAGGGVVRMLESIFEAVTQTIGTIVAQFRIMMEMIGLIVEGTKALASGDFDRYWELGTRFRELMDEFGQITGGQWDWFRDWWANGPSARANGGRATFGGMTWVGERGPELVNLPGGSHVYTAAQSAAMAGGRMDIYVHGESSLPMDRTKIREIARQLQRDMQFAGARVLAV